MLDLNVFKTGFSGSENNSMLGNFCMTAKFLVESGLFSNLSTISETKVNDNWYNETTGSFLIN